MNFQNILGKVNEPQLLFARFYYFLYMGSWGFVLPFMNLYYTSLGLNGKQIGIIASASALVGLIAAPIIVSNIKKHPKARTFLQFLLFWGAFGYFLIGVQKTFEPIIIIVILQTLAVSSISTLSDSMAVAITKVTDSGYGSIRVWGSFGWILIVPFAGWRIEYLGYITGFSGIFVGWACAAGILFFLPQHFFTSASSNEKPRTSLTAILQKTYRNKVLLGFGIALVAIGFLNNGVLQFENVYLSNLGASKQLISIAGILSALVELPFMLISDRILKRIGAHRMLMIALTMTLIQRSVVMLFPSIITIMIVRFIGGMAFSFYTISYIGLIAEQTKTEETSTVLALFTVTLSGMVNIIASPLSGAVYDLIGARWFYAFSAMGYLIAIVSLWYNHPAKYSPQDM
jgi:MFS transporter, PPP family, 3-phenylpropionic acid transporter